MIKLSASKKRGVCFFLQEKLNSSGNSFPASQSIEHQGLPSSEKIIETFEKKTAGFAHKHRRVFFKARRLLRILSKANNQPYDWGNDLNTPFPSVIARVTRVLPSADSKATEA